jgi:hypothetical protein
VATTQRDYLATYEGSEPFAWYKQGNPEPITARHDPYTIDVVYVLEPQARTRNYHQNEAPKMEGQTTKGLRIALLVYTVYSVVYGLVHVVSPEMVMAKDPAIERVLGAAVLAFALGAGLAYIERAWERVKIVVLVQVTWMILYTITMAWGILVGGITAVAWAPTLIGAVFAILLATLYIREERIKR